ncbi:radical SAM (seleno)protein TrsS [Acetobacterium wieringae]|uniref:radical SAM (seleno)protein TrsS n=1 Tax=Acetobacterium wieringae TaxID=52694 RepID=UPI0020349451|nr:radical SAM (seleno)protein TrsS [Acetobacterium wieringae]URN83209.1 radical SAM protein [Acetobacterium wieringae]
MKRIISTTESLCPVCLKKINALIWSENAETWMEKSCPEHGRFKALLWRGSIPMAKWVRNKIPATIKKPNTAVEKGCPFDCGLCAEHRQHTCTALIEVTQRCNLNCSFCFADANGNTEADLDLETIRRMYQSAMDTSGNCNIQLSGGEPTLRDDLPEIIRIGHELGFSFIQINTNGIRMGEDEAYVSALKNAGLNSVFLQFDGTNDEIYKKLRGKPLLATKIKAIKNCQRYNIGVVLVPTLVREVNDSDLGNIINFGLEWAPTVKGVHMQPASYFGRIPNLPDEQKRLTLGDLIDKIEVQTQRRIRKDSFSPPGCENARCSFHGNYTVSENGELIAQGGGAKCCGGEKAEEGARKAKAHVVRKWSGAGSEPQDDGIKKSIAVPAKDGWDAILEQINRHSFSLSAMAFQDVWNLDLNRVKDCCIHVVNPQGQLIPFCMYNLTDKNGHAIYRQQ